MMDENEETGIHERLNCIVQGHIWNQVVLEHWFAELGDERFSRRNLGFTGGLIETEADQRPTDFAICRM